MHINCLYVSLLSHFWLIHFSPTPALSIIFRPWSSYMCSVTQETAKVGRSYSHMWGRGIGCWFSDRSNCSQWSFEAVVLPINPNIYTDQWELILTPTTVVQGVHNHSWGLYCRRCYCFCVCSECSSRIFHSSRWLGQLYISTVLTMDESPHTGYTFTPWVVSFAPPSIEH